MAQGLSDENPLKSTDGSKVKIKRDDLLTSDSTQQEILLAILKELRELKFLVASAV